MANKSGGKQVPNSSSDAVVPTHGIGAFWPFGKSEDPPPKEWGPIGTRERPDLGVVIKMLDLAPTIPKGYTRPRHLLMYDSFVLLHYSLETLSVIFESEEEKGVRPELGPIFRFWINKLKSEVDQAAAWFDAHVLCSFSPKDAEFPIVKNSPYLSLRKLLTLPKAKDDFLDNLREAGIIIEKSDYESEDN